MSAGISAIRIPATGTHKASIIWLHGLGDSGRGWAFLAKLYSFPNVKWIFPNAPPIPITVNAGRRMPGWFDIKSLHEIQKGQDEDGMLKSANLVQKLITEEVDAGISSENIIVGGFSQGCAIALLAGYTSERKLAGVVGLSGYLPLDTKFAAMRSEANMKTPLFLAHGMEDMVVDFRFGKMSYLALKAMGIDVQFEEFEDLGHSADEAELRMVRNWIKKTIDTGDEQEEKKAEESKV